MRGLILKTFLNISAEIGGIKFIIDTEYPEYNNDLLIIKEKIYELQDKILYHESLRHE